MFRRFYLLGVLALFSTTVLAQFSIRGGINFSQQQKRFPSSELLPAYTPSDLNTLQIGIMYQAISAKGWGIETGLLFVEKGTTFTYATDSTAETSGYNSINMVEIPLNLKYRYRIGIFGVYASAGIYTGYSLEGKTVIADDVMPEIAYETPNNRLDFGYNASAGIELFKKIQMGVTWSETLLEIHTVEMFQQLPIEVASKNRLITVHVNYLF